jgi:Spy/CpxP family protein refolding chaperone
MIRPRFNVVSAVAAAAVVLASTLVASAQPGEGEGRRRGGFGGPRPLTSIRLARADEVAAALSLTDEQKDKVAKINDQLRDDVQKGFESGNGFEKMRELYQAAAAELAEVLDDNQEKRLMGILIQVNGAGATVDPAVAKELNITDEQKQKLEDTRREIGESMRESFRELRDLPEEERTKKAEELRAEANKKLLAVLDADQQAKLESLKGEPVKIDMAQFRMGRDFGGRGGEGRREGRGGRDRGDRDSSDTEKNSGNN